jgi:hypothetical protein
MLLLNRILFAVKIFSCYSQLLKHLKHYLPIKLAFCGTMHLVKVQLKYYSYMSYLLFHKLTSILLEKKCFINTSGDISFTILFGLISELIKSHALLHLFSACSINDILHAILMFFILILYKFLPRSYNFPYSLDLAYL